ncbi:MBL fold metallo-hydrolase [Shewanella surugensis]|uniref:MBL fold metallo-hydrolase n=1 Tax=Shewanella surugensis TaxID=212020 RepID=A0ABT0LA83_9GAMM|nr:MBL fold metallo-hydrolase [Shewanella surugensis]MCL1124624.1 MBL fold metallo-hydrolase [Shewanella surugensis]
MSSIIIHAFFHQESYTISYIIHDKQSLEAIIIDSALDFDLQSRAIQTRFADKQIDYIQQYSLSVKWIAETHIHADHLTAAQYIKNQLGGEIIIGRGIINTQAQFNQQFPLHKHSLAIEHQFDRLLQNNDQLTIGQTEITVLATPGHTQDSMTYLIENNAFIGDTLFMPDSGSARCDFQGGCAKTLFTSIQRLYSLPDQTTLWICHDYQPNNRPLGYQTSVQESKMTNIHIQQKTLKDDFIQLRKTRDNNLMPPKLLYLALPFNIQSGVWPIDHNTFSPLPFKGA